MQQLLESRPFERLANEGMRRGGNYYAAAGGGGRSGKLRYVLFGVGLFIVAIFLLSGFGSATGSAHHTLVSLGGGEGEAGGGRSSGSRKEENKLPHESRRSRSQRTAKTNDDDSDNDDDTNKQRQQRKAGKIDAVDSSAPPPPSASIAVELLSPWGYNKDRNVPRGRAIFNSIAADIAAGRFSSGGGFTVVDYGSDQGYFSISTAKIFKRHGAFVMGIEMGGVGGEIWKKEGSQDVLEIQQDKIRENDLNSNSKIATNMLICQTRATAESFFALKEKNLVSDYQFVLSVFHWFDLPTRAAFDKALATLFLNSRTTFIELPIIGDNGPLIRKQVGWKNFVKWYDGRSDMTQIMVEAAEAHGLSIKVTLVAAVPWVKWQRETYRVDVLSFQGSEGPPATVFGCEERRKIYKCADRPLHSLCPAYE